MTQETTILEMIDSRELAAWYGMKYIFFDQQKGSQVMKSGAELAGYPRWLWNGVA